MKGLLIFCLVLTVVTAVPLKGKLKNYSRKQLRQDVVNAPAPTPSAKVPVIGAAPVDIIATRPVVGNKPFGETEEAARPVPVPAKEPEVLPSQATVVQPAVVVPQPVPANVPQPLVTVAQPAPAVAQPVPVLAQPEPAPAQPVPAPAQPVAVAVAIPAQPIPPAEVLAQPVQPAFVNGSLQSAGEPEAAAAQPAVPAPPPVVVVPQPPAPPLAPGTEPVVTPAPVEVSTKKPESEEDDSSSEEEEAEARQLTVAPNSNAQLGPNVKDFVVNAFVTPNGEVLVPLDVYQKYFHQHQSPARRNQVPLGIFSRQENEPTSSASSEEENDADASGENSEESIPVRVSGVKPEKVKPVKSEPAENVSNVDEEDEIDEKEKPAAVSENENETDDKSASAESEEKPAAVAGAESGAPVEPVNSFVRPPLAAIPATRPTQEDDEEEAGRYAFPFYDEFFQDDGAYENEFFQGNNYYRIEPRDEESGFEF